MTYFLFFGKKFENDLFFGKNDLDAHLRNPHRNYRDSHQINHHQNHHRNHQDSHKVNLHHNRAESPIKKNVEDAYATMTEEPLEYRDTLSDTNKNEFESLWNLKLDYEQHDL